jgi:peptidyl-prolyl cis-trans isomerase A (cyclophilin A)
VFHRFWKGSLNFVQGGSFTYDVNQIGDNRYVDKASTLSPIVLESTVNSNLTNTAGTIAMARTSVPDSATAGFFVNTAANAGFNSTNTRDGYAVFGSIAHGAASWSALLDSVASTGEVTKPSTPAHLHWAYQIQ